MKSPSSRLSLHVIVNIAALLSVAFLVNGQSGIFEDNFEDPNLPGWEQTPNVYADGGILHLEPGGFAAPEGMWQAFELVMQIRYMGQGDIAILYNLNDEGGSILLYNGTRFQLQREQSGQVEFIGEEISFIIPSGEWFQFSMWVTPDEQTVLVNDEVVFTAPLAAPLSAGRLGFETHHELTLEVEHFILISEGAEPVEESTPETMEESEEGAQPSSGESPSDRPPAYQVESWTHLGGPIGGLGYDIRHSFENHDVWYATDAWSGIHRSFDSGLTWEPINEGITATKGVDAVPVFCATVDPHDSQVVWIGTEGTGHIYRTSDGGDTWVEMTNGIDPTLRPLTFRGFTVDPKQQDTVFAMGEISSMAWTVNREQQVGLEMDMTMGIVYKTTDGGRNWREVWRGNNLARYAWIHPNDTDIIYISTGIFDREAANTDVEARIAGGVGILKSTDGGQTWRELNQENGLLDLFIGSLFMHPERPDTLLAAASQNNWSGFFEESTAGIYLTEDGGESWERVLQGNELFATVEYCEVDPTIAYAASEQAVYRSEDGGRTWDRFSRPENTWGPPGTIAGIPIDMQCDPENPERIFINNYNGGNFLSEDGGRSWIDASQGYSGASIRNVVIATDQPGWIYSSGRSGLFRSTDGGETWIGLSNPGPDFPHIALNEVSALAVSPENPLDVLSAPGDLAKPMFSHDGGQSWSLALGVTGAPVKIVYAPGNPSTVYAAVSHLGCLSSIPGTIMQELCAEAESFFYISTDGGETWRPTSESGPPGNGIVNMVIHPEEAQSLVAATLLQSVMISNDGGQSWREINNGLPREDVVNAIAMDPSQPTTLFVGYREFGLYKTDDNGSSWRKITAGLNPEAFIKSIVVDPTDSNIIYLADHWSGVYISTDGGESWSSHNDGLTHRTANVLALSSDGTVLYVGIEGAGVYRLGAPPPVQGADQLTGTSNLEQEEPVVEDTPFEEPPAEEERESEETTPRFSLPCIGGTLPAFLLSLVSIIAITHLRRKEVDPH